MNSHKCISWFERKTHDSHPLTFTPDPAVIDVRIDRSAFVRVVFQRALFDGAIVAQQGHLVEALLHELRVFGESVEFAGGQFHFFEVRSRAIVLAAGPIFSMMCVIKRNRKAHKCYLFPSATLRCVPVQAVESACQRILLFGRDKVRLHVNAGKRDPFSAAMLGMCPDHVVHLFAREYSIAFVAKHVALQCLFRTVNAFVKHMLLQVEVSKHHSPCSH